MSHNFQIYDSKLGRNLDIIHEYAFDVDNTAYSIIWHPPFVRCLHQEEGEHPSRVIRQKQPQANYFCSFYSSSVLPHNCAAFCWFMQIIAKKRWKDWNIANKFLFSSVIQPWKLSSLYRGKLLLMTFPTDSVHRNYYSAAPPGMNIYRRSCRLHCFADALINWFLGIEAGNILAATALFMSPAWQIELLSELLLNILSKSIEIDDENVGKSCLHRKNVWINFC